MDTPATMNAAQEATLRKLCERYGVTFRHTDYLVHPDDSWMMPGYAEGWIGGAECSESSPAHKWRTIFVGVDREGVASS